MATLATLKAYARHQARDMTGSKADYDLTGAINDALGMIARDRQWAWFQTHGTVSLQAPYSTGTLTFTLGSANVTLATGTWPSWAASGKILYGGKWLRIASRTSDSVIVLQTAWVEATVAGAAYVLYRDEYTLPTDCGRFARLFPGTGWVWGGEPVGLDDVLQAYNAYSGGQSYPRMWALYKDQIILWPYPSTSTVVNIMYYRLPAELTADANTADWDTMQAELLYRAIDHQLSIRVGNVVAGDPGTTRAMYKDALDRAVKSEKVPQSRGTWFPGANTGEFPVGLSFP
jgi:hypothetical protein